MAEQREDFPSSAQVRDSRLEPEAERLIDSYLTTKLKKWAALFGSVNVIAVLGGYLYIVENSAERAARKAEELAESAIESNASQWGTLQNNLLDQVSSVLTEAGGLKRDLENSSAEIEQLDASIQEIAGAAPQQLSSLARLLSEHGDGLPEALEIGTIRKKLDQVHELEKKSEARSKKLENRLLQLEGRVESNSQRSQSNSSALNTERETGAMEEFAARLVSVEDRLGSVALSCRLESKAAKGKENTNVPCGQGWFVTGGGMKNADLEDNLVIEALGPSGPRNTWTCDTPQNDEEYICYAICCSVVTN